MAILDDVYPWLVFLHVLGVFVFLLAPGVSAGVGFKLRREMDHRGLALCSTSPPPRIR